MTQFEELIPSCRNISLPIGFRMTEKDFIFIYNVFIIEHFIYHLSLNIFK